MTRAAVTGCTADFTVGTAALLKGLARHHPEVKRIVFAPADQVGSVTGELGDLAEVRPIPRRLRNSPDDAKLLVSWSRVFIPDVAADAVAWFDSDVILCRPAPEWWEVPPGKVNAVADRAYRIRHMVPHGMERWYFDQFKLEPDSPGFNAGIFALRPVDHKNLADRFEGLLAGQDARRQPFAFDQGLLNGLFWGNVNWLPAEFNAHCLAECGVPRDVRVIHFTGSPKPWAEHYDKSSEGYYHWLRHGECLTDARRLAMVNLRVQLAKPRRFAYKAVRKMLSSLGLWRREMGVGRRPDAP